MYHNAFESVKSKIRAAETAPADEKESCFVQVARGTDEDKQKRRKVKKPEVDIREYFTANAKRDNIMAFASQYLSEKELARVICTSKAAFENNVSLEEARKLSLIHI